MTRTSTGPAPGPLTIKSDGILRNSSGASTDLSDAFCPALTNSQSPNAKTSEKSLRPRSLLASAMTVSQAYLAYLMSRKASPGSCAFGTVQVLSHISLHHER